MRLVIITAEDEINDDLLTCSQILERDIRLHVRKPKWTVDEISQWVEKLPQKHYSKISLHGNLDLCLKLGLGGIHWKSDQKVDKNIDLIQSKSFHSTKNWDSDLNHLEYGFLSPIFNSISKKGYQANFDLERLKEKLSNSPSNKVLALGGVTPSHREQIIGLGFGGMAILGALWSESDVKKRLKIINDLTNE